MVAQLVEHQPRTQQEVIVSSPTQAALKITGCSRCIHLPCCIVPVYITLLYMEVMGVAFALRPTNYLVTRNVDNEIVV